MVTQVDKLHFSEKTDVDVLSEIYERLLRDVASVAGYAGEFYTPRHIIGAMVQVVKPRLGDKIYDPCFGSGGFLWMGATEIRRNAGPMGIDKLEQFHKRTIYGRELGPLAYLNGTMGLLLHDVHQANLELVNTLEVHTNSVVAKIRECLSRVAEVRSLQEESLVAARALMASYLSEFEASVNWPLVLVASVILASNNGRSIRSDGDSGNGRVLTLSSVRDIILNVNAAKTVSLDQRLAPTYSIAQGDVFVSRSNTIDLVGLTTSQGRRDLSMIRRSTYVLIDGLQTVGDFGQHPEGEVVAHGFGMSVCLSALQVVEQLTSDLRPAE